ncbi:hypothetical protein GAO09_26590 [Rhizobiales bacterium RZME27]|uniref:Uncharacterized protein n=1 Tax=Endobacterium cereale TaxID=2663029 RepID=A0A6A8ALK5_9HYPH|nr:hypothetical protein [Endobacterium cereale]MQY49601.1 hypothetical protein [Endobacterium cereale]
MNLSTADLEQELEKRDAYSAHSAMYITAISNYDEDYIYQYFQELEKSSDSYAIIDKIIEMFVIPHMQVMNQASFKMHKEALEFLIENPPSVEDVDDLNEAAAYLFGLPEDEGALKYLFNRIYDEFFKDRDTPLSTKDK